MNSTVKEIITLRTENTPIVFCSWVSWGNVSSTNTQSEPGLKDKRVFVKLEHEIAMDIQIHGWWWISLDSWKLKIFQHNHKKEEKRTWSKKLNSRKLFFGCKILWSLAASGMKKFHGISVLDSLHNIKMRCLFLWLQNVCDLWAHNSRNPIKRCLFIYRICSTNTFMEVVFFFRTVIILIVVVLMLACLHRTP